jgi:tetratricopeptide (TPR) repeat protein
MQRRFVTAVGVVMIGAGLLAQTPARQQLARGMALWDQRLSKSAIEALESAARNRPTPAEAAEIHEALGRISMFKGWQQEGVFPGWHDEPGWRAKALAELKAAIAADPARLSAQEALRVAEGFAAADAVDPAPPRPEVRALDTTLQSFQTPTSGPDPAVGQIVAAVDARARAQADPAPYFTGAQILIDRGEYDRAIALAERGATVSDHFIDENLSAYQLSGKSQGSYARGRGSAADLIGWALFQKKEYAAAAAKLEEAERLSQGQDVLNQFHLGELARAQNAPARARGHFLNALSLAGGPPPLRQRTTQALSALYAADHDAAGFDGWLESELSRRRDDRRTDALKSLVNRPLPTLALTTVDGRPFDTSSLQGKVLLLNFFASW